jgi:TolB-like protein
MGKSGRLVAISLLVFGLCAVAVFSLFGPWKAPGGAHVLAVLPLKSPSADAADAALGLAMSDALIRRLSATGALTVSSGGAGADTRLEGTVQAAGGRLRVGVRLVRVGDGRILWKQSFDVPESEAPAVESAILEAVSTRLRLK